MAAEARIRYASTDEQDALIWSSAKYTLGSGGYGAGKSHALAIASAVECSLNPGLAGMVVADTFGRLYRDFLPKLRTVLEASDIDIEPVRLEIGSERVPGWLVGPGWLDHTLLFGSMQRPAALKGPTLSHVEIEEATTIPRLVTGLEEPTFNVLASRLRAVHPDGTPGTNRLKASGTPESMGNWTCDAGMFWRAPDEAERVESWRRDFRVIKMRTKDNAFNAPDYFQSMWDIMTPTQRAEKLDGTPSAGMKGGAYPDFDRDRNVARVQFNRFKGDVLIGMDFNVNPMCAILGQLWRGELHVFDEIFQKHSDTQRMGEEIVARLRRLGVPIDACRIFPDASGRARHTSGPSDFVVLRNLGLKRIGYPESGNPRVSDRLNVVNARLFHRIILIDPSCKYLIRDLSNVTRADDGSLVKAEWDLTHMSDALGYLVLRVLPIHARAGIAFGRPRAA